MKTDNFTPMNKAKWEKAFTAVQKISKKANKAEFFLVAHDEAGLKKAFAKIIQDSAKALESLIDSGIAGKKKK